MVHTRHLFDLSGKIALITGASRGLGFQMARAIGEMGAKIAITARKKEELEQAAQMLQKDGIEVLSRVHDLAQQETIPALVDDIVNHYGSIDILVNNAGTTWGAPAEEYPKEAWHKVMNLNVHGTFFLTQEIGKRIMIPKKQGKIINIASIAGLFGNPPGMETIAYNTSKGAIVNFTRALAAEWGEHNIHVNAICPGFFPSKMSQVLLEQMKDTILSMTPLRRVGGDDDLKGVVVFLASEASRHMTGQCLVVDGGATVI